VSRDNVIEIATRFTEAPPVDVLRAEYDDCRHEHTAINERIRTISCVDCREERLDPIEVLISLARQWRRWQYEAEQLRKLNNDYYRIEREKWERRRDRHLSAHPDHRSRYRLHGDLLVPAGMPDPNARDARGYGLAQVMPDPKGGRRCSSHPAAAGIRVAGGGRSIAPCGRCWR
jgi:hypothetical protein